MATARRRPARDRPGRTRGACPYRPRRWTSGTCWRACGGASPAGPWTQASSSAWTPLAGTARRTWRRCASSRRWGTWWDNGFATGAVRLTSSWTDPGASVELAVRDDGPGFPRGFWTTPSSASPVGRRAVERRGRDWGLAIVEAIAVAHGAEAVARNVDGAGTEVVMTLRVRGASRGSPSGPRGTRSCGPRSGGGPRSSARCSPRSRSPGLGSRTRRSRSRSSTGGRSRWTGRGVLDAGVVAVAADPAHQHHPARVGRPDRGAGGHGDVQARVEAAPARPERGDHGAVHRPDQLPAALLDRARRRCCRRRRPEGPTPRAPARPRARRGRPRARACCRDLGERAAPVVRADGELARATTRAAPAPTRSGRAREGCARRRAARGARGSRAGRPGSSALVASPRTSSVISRSWSEMRSRNSARSSRSPKPSASRITVSASGASAL